LKAEDTDDYSRGSEYSTASSEDAGSSEPHIVIENGAFKWGEPGTALADQKEPEKKKKFKMTNFFKKKKAEETPEDETIAPETEVVESKRNTLEDINVSMKSGKLTGVVGRVGSGKSSLVSAILGEMQKMEGEVSLNGTVAYVAQTAWIFNDTLKNNILFGKEFDEELYKRAIKVSALEHDIEVLPAGDLTSIGEKGINLSGGQKQRVSIARAVYADRDVYIFDDPLSALDAHVSQTVFDECISNKGALKDRLRLLITNQVHVLPNCDNIVLLEDGRIRNQGTYQKLASEDSSFQEIVNDMSSKEKEKEQKNTTESIAETQDVNAAENESTVVSHTEESKKEGQKLVKEEDREVGNIKLSSYRKYAVACGGALLFSLVIVFWALVVALGIYAQYWLAYWADQEALALKTGVQTRGLSFYIGIYSLLGFGFAILLCLRSIAFLKLALRASKKFHSQALASLMRAPMSFFDTTPIGRILSRFSRDVGAVDQMLPQVFSQMLTTVFQLIGSYVLIAIILPPFLGAALPITIGYWFLQRFFNRTSLEVKRLDSISKSPIYAHFSETLSGLSTIRAYKKQESAIGENRGMIDINTRAYFTFIATSRWFSLYLEILGSTLIFFTALFAVLVPMGATPSELGLSLSNVLQVTGILGFTIRSITEVENWPEKGAIEIEDASLRYREGLELVLKGVSVKINPGEKVGVIGRTGSGKSTLMVAILRLVELAGGSIKVDNVNIEKLGLNHVRKSITIIPQDPVLFSGTIRFNLDPFDVHSDTELWDALEKSSMKRFVEEFDGGLDSFVSEYGENMSAGQRQLICLSRALLRKSKILILDEASSSLDAETDRFIQESIRNHMNDATILTIAHRLSTLADYDRIMVMESGYVAEYGTPSELLEKRNSKLTGFVNSLGKHGADQFREIVRKNR